MFDPFRRETGVVFVLRFIRENLWHRIREGVHVRDNVRVVLTDIHTGRQTVISSHNISTNYEFSALSQWLAGKNNTGYQPLSPPTQIQLGSGAGTPAVTDTALFSPIANTITTMSNVTAGSPTAGTSTFTFQIAAGIVTVQVTEAGLRDVSGNLWSHTMFGIPFTPSSTQTVTIQWEKTYSA